MSCWGARLHHDMRAPFRLLIGVVLVAVSAALFAIAFRSSLAWLYGALYGAGSVVDAITSLPGWLRLTVPVAAAAVAGTIARFRPPGVQNVSNVMEAVALGRVQLSMRVTMSRVASSWTAIAGGMSIGREGPLIEMGGALGAALGRRLRTLAHRDEGAHRRRHRGGLRERRTTHPLRRACSCSRRSPASRRRRC